MAKHSPRTLAEDRHRRSPEVDEGSADDGCSLKMPPGELLVDQGDGRAFERVTRIEGSALENRNAQRLQVSTRNHFYSGKRPLIGRNWPVSDVKPDEALRVRAVELR